MEFTQILGSRQGEGGKIFSMRICVLVHILAVAQEGSQEGGSIFPDTLPAQEQNIDHGAPGAKRRHHFREVTKKVAFRARALYPALDNGYSRITS